MTKIDINEIAEPYEFVLDCKFLDFERTMKILDLKASILYLRYVKNASERQAVSIWDKHSIDYSDRIAIDIYKYINEIYND